MYNRRQFGHILVTVFCGTVTLEDVATLVEDTKTITETLDEVYILSLPIGATDIPKNVGQLVKTLAELKSTLNKIQRLYHIQINPFISFIGTTVTQVLRLNSLTIEAKDLDDLYRIMTLEAELFPSLKASLVHMDEIKAYIAEFETLAN